MKKIILASNNKNKIREIKQILKDFKVEIISLKEAGINIEVEENGNTFIENAYIKAKAIYDLKKGEYMVLADDSGLEVDVLNGEPGVYSARFAGEHGNDKKNNEKLLSLLKDKKGEDRKGKFVCAMVLIVKEDKVIEVEGEVNGYISEKELGEDGFGYDPLFYVPEKKMTFGQMNAQDKNEISHRSNALNKLRDKILDENIINT